MLAKIVENSGGKQKYIPDIGKGADASVKIYFTPDLWVLIIAFIIFFAVSLYERKKAKTKSFITQDIFYAIVFIYLIVILFIPVIEGDLTVDNEGNSYIVIENRYFSVRNKHKIMKFDGTGQLKWVKNYPFDASALYKAKFLTDDENSNLYIGFERDEEDKNYLLKKEGKTAYSYLAKIDPEGKVIWDTSSAAKINALQTACGKLRLLGISESGDVATEAYGLEDGEPGQPLFVPVRFGYLNTVCVDEGGDIICLNNITRTLSKFTSEGGKLWVTSTTTSDAMVVVSDRENNVFVGGGDQRSAAIQKYNPGGEVLWSTAFQPVESGADNYILDISTDYNGNAYAAGFVRMLAETEGQIQKSNSFLAKISSAGEVVWVKTEVFPQASNLFSYKQFDVDNDGNVYITNGGSWFKGASLTKFGIDGQKEWKAITPGLKLVLTIMVLALAALNFLPKLKEKFQIRSKSRLLKLDRR